MIMWIFFKLYSRFLVLWRKINEHYEIWRKNTASVEHVRAGFDNDIDMLSLSPSRVKESDNESDRIQPADKIWSDSGLWTDIRIPSVGIR
jgi:hypothetical protein